MSYHRDTTSHCRFPPKEHSAMHYTAPLRSPDPVLSLRCRCSSRRCASKWHLEQQGSCTTAAMSAPVSAQRSVAVSQSRDVLGRALSTGCVETYGVPYQDSSSSHSSAAHNILLLLLLPPLHMSTHAVCACTHSHTHTHTNAPR